MSQITTHILDTARGCPAVGVPIRLERLEGDEWCSTGSGVTNADGRVPDLCAAGTVLAAGTYRMNFDTTDYFRNLAATVFYPWADVVFVIDGDGQHYHIPLLLADYGYSTYRGS